VLEVLYHHAKFGVAQISPAAGACVSVYRGSALAHHIWPSSVKGVGTGVPKCQNLPKIVSK